MGYVLLVMGFLIGGALGQTEAVGRHWLGILYALALLPPWTTVIRALYRPTEEGPVRTATEPAAVRDRAA
jgi:hypothetical protein